jgi:hypothetical protein
MGFQADATAAYRGWVRLWPSRSSGSTNRCEHRSPDGRHRCQLVRGHPRDINHIAQVNGQPLCWYGVVTFPPPRHGQLPWAPTFPRDEP